MIILDTNVISEVYRKSPDPGVMAWLNAQAPSNLFLTSVTVGELMFGVHCLPPGARLSQLFASVTAMIDEDFNGRILSYDDAAARIYGEQVGNARKAGVTIGLADGRIAAIAIANDASFIATRDIGPFEAMGVSVINPWG